MTTLKFNIELELTDNDMKKLRKMYNIANRDGLYETFDFFVEECINFRLLRHTVDSAEIMRDIQKGLAECKQT